MENAENAGKKFQKKDWGFIQPLQTAWNANKIIFSFVSVFILILIDQYTKTLAFQKNLPLPEVFLNPVCNPNLSLGIEIISSIFILFWIIAFIFLLYLAIKHKSFFLILVLAGTLSNLLDRIYLGCVIDYISIFNFPIFNLADVLISFGFTCFLFSLKTKSPVNN